MMQSAEVVQTLQVHIYLKILKERADLWTNEALSACMQTEDS